MITACAAVKEVPVTTTTNTVTNYIDSLRIRDSIRIIPIERYVDIVRPLDTLRMSTSIAEAECYLDVDLNMLRGEIRNKQGILNEYHSEEHLTAKSDTLEVEKEVPVYIDKIEYKTPRWAWYSLIFNILGILCLSLCLYLKVKK